MRQNNTILEQGPILSWVVALVATLGSLYFSEVREFIPCTYCWYQRILMYPLVIILGIAAVRKDYGQALYVLPLSILGIGMSAYHYTLQKTDLFQSGSGDGCGIIPCTTEYINWLGFITIPFLALIAFSLITVLQLMVWKASRG
jgi:disulfide bond formation protein DsbB